MSVNVVQLAKNRRQTVYDNSMLRHITHNAYAACSPHSTTPASSRRSSRGCRCRGMQPY